MKKLIFSVAVMFAMSSFCAFAQDAKPAKKETAKTEQSCKKDAKATDKKIVIIEDECCQKDAKADKQACSQKETKKKATPKKAVADKK
ncbi:MAG: hypothetical protein LBS07_04395 [Prevotellaceae bacterium]|jgi:hypothetical protein|nr:hypothetical protein [Prevotellaceae bacterium]